MGYELSISRDDELTKITLNEWIKYIESDLSFNLVHELSAVLGDGKKMTIQIPNAGIWHYKGEEVPFTFSEKFGEVSVKNPEEYIIKKMIEIAGELNAIVRGEEGEEYTTEYIQEVSIEKELAVEKIVKKKWWKFW